MCGMSCDCRYTYDEAVEGEVSIEFGVLYGEKYRNIVSRGQKDWAKMVRVCDAISHLAHRVLKYI